MKIIVEEEEDGKRGEAPVVKTVSTVVEAAGRLRIELKRLR